MARTLGCLPSRVLDLTAGEFAVNDAILEAAERETAEDLAEQMMKLESKDPLGVGRAVLALSHLVTRS